MRLCKKIYETASDRSCHAMSCFARHALDPSLKSSFFIVVFHSAVFKSSLPCQHQLVVGARIKLDLLLRILIVSGGDSGGTYLLLHSMSMSCLWLVLFWPLHWLTWLLKWWLRKENNNIDDSEECEVKRSSRSTHTNNKDRTLVTSFFMGGGEAVGLSLISS